MNHFKPLSNQIEKTVEIQNLTQLEEFLQELEQARKKMVAQGFRDFTVGIEDVDDEGNPGFVLSGRRPETEKEKEIREESFKEMEEYTKRRELEWYREIKERYGL